MFEENLEKNYVSVLHREETVEINKIKYFGQALTTLKHSWNYQMIFEIDSKINNTNYGGKLTRQALH